MPSNTSKEKHIKIYIREQLVNLLEQSGNNIFKEEIIKIVFRPMNELYIPVPDSRNFHSNNPNFFVNNLIDQFDENGKFLSKISERTFNLVFEPSGESLPCYISQQWGKAIESTEKQTLLGEWILRKIFQLKEFEPLTDLKLSEIGINALKLYKQEDSQDIHMQFIWID